MLTAALLLTYLIHCHAQVDHQLFALNKVDVLGDNREEVIVCAWDGQTYIVDHDRNVVRYQFQDNVQVFLQKTLHCYDSATYKQLLFILFQAFCAGKYSADGKTNLPCLVYADFHNKITLFYDVRLSFLKATDFLTVANGDAEMREVFAELGINAQEVKIFINMTDSIVYCNSKVMLIK